MVKENCGPSSTRFFETMRARRKSIHNSLNNLTTVGLFAISLSLTSTVTSIAAAQDDDGGSLDPNLVRNFISSQVGGLDNCRQPKARSVNGDAQT